MSQRTPTYLAARNMRSPNPGVTRHMVLVASMAACVFCILQLNCTMLKQVLPRTQYLRNIYVVSPKEYIMVDGSGQDMRALANNYGNKDDGENFFVSHSDPIFAGTPISTRSFQTVRKTYSTQNEITQPMAVVPLPTGFQGEYRPETLKEFIKLARTIFDDSEIGRSLQARSSQIEQQNNLHGRDSPEYAIVSICVGMDLCDISKRNHQHYADTHGYDYLPMSTNVDGIHPKMLKYLLLAWTVQRGYKWVMMLDADALFTNMDITLPSLIDSTQPSNSTSLIATRGGNWQFVHGINNGIFLLKSNEWSLQHCFDIFTAKYAYTRFLGRTLIDQPLQMSVLLAQNELQWPPKTELERGAHVTIVPKRTMNSFRREHSFSSADEKEDGQWQHGDFIAHFASGKKYSLMLDLLEEEGLASEIPPVEERFSFPLPAKGKASRTGHCWCNHAAGNSINGENELDTPSSSVSCLPSYHVVGVHKAGTKSILRYLSGHPGLASTGYIEDPTRWLTEKTMKVEEEQCAAMAKTAAPHTPSFLQKPRTRVVSTCSFDDYALLNGQVSNGVCSSPASAFAPASAAAATADSGVGGSDEDLAVSAVPYFPEEEKPLFDEMNIWDHSFDKIRGVSLPEVFHRMQPEANLLVTVRDSVDVTYSAYNHFGVFASQDSASTSNQGSNSNTKSDGVQKGPAHFDMYIRSVVVTWTQNGCTAANYRKCLPSDMVQAGSWLSRAMYSKVFSEWLSHFQCSQVHLFDVSVDPRTEVERLYDFVGMPNKAAAEEVTQSTYTLQSNATAAASFGGRRDKNPMNKASYDAMLDTTRQYLNEFYGTFDDEMCDLMIEHPCLDVPLFRRKCQMKQADVLDGVMSLTT